VHKIQFSSFIKPPKKNILISNVPCTCTKTCIRPWSYKSRTFNLHTITKGTHTYLLYLSLVTPNIDFLQAYPNNLKYFKYEWVCIF